MESINSVIDDSSETKLVESKDSDIFYDQGSFENTTNNVNTPNIIPTDPPRTSEEEEKDEQEESLSKWAKNAHFTDNIIDNV